MSAEKRQQIIDELRLIKKDNNAIKKNNKFVKKHIKSAI